MIYYTSDLHLGHRNCAERRGFTDVEEHDRTILFNIADTLTRGDHLWILGDLSLGGTSNSGRKVERRALALLNELTPYFDLHLILGNHDSAHPIHVGSNNRLAEFNEVFQSVQERICRRVPENRHKRIWFSHFPYHGDGDRNSTEDRYPEPRLHDNGVDYLVHGHLHTEQHWTGPRSIHIGLDAWNLRPVSLDTVNAMILDREQELAAA